MRYRHVSISSKPCWQLRFLPTLCTRDAGFWLPSCVSQCEDTGRCIRVTDFGLILSASAAQARCACVSEHQRLRLVSVAMRDDTNPVPSVMSRAESMISPENTQDEVPIYERRRSSAWVHPTDLSPRIPRTYSGPTVR